MSKLTDRQRMFCSEFIRDWNSTRAAIAAGYSKRSAGPIASRLLRKDNIRAYINAIQTDIEKQAGMTKLRSVLEYKAIAFSSIADFHSSWMERKDFDGLSHEQKSA